jgi:hypothetical protein
MDPVELRRTLEPLLAGDLVAWHGLPDIGLTDLEAALGEPVESGSVQVGAYRARRLEFSAAPGRPTLAAFVRDERVFMVEVLPPPDISAVIGLPEPTAILPQEIAVDGAYAHEYLYGERGLVVTLAQELDEAEPRRVVRCRGIRPIARTEEFGPEYYTPLDTDIKW